MDNGYVDIVFQKEILTCCTEQLKKRKKLLSQKICLCSNAIQHKRILIRFCKQRSYWSAYNKCNAKKKNHSRTGTSYKSDTGNKAYAKMTKLNCNVFISPPMQHCPEVSGSQLIRIYFFNIYDIQLTVTIKSQKNPSFIDPHAGVYLSQYILCVYSREQEYGKRSTLNRKAQNFLKVLSLYLVFILYYIIVFILCYI